MIKTNKDTDFTTTVLTIFDLVKHKLGFSARITDMWALLKIAYSVDEFDILDSTQILNGPLQSYLIDEQVNWQEGKKVDFRKMYNAILDAGDFTGAEKRMFEDGNIEERLWAIMLAVVDPSRDLNKK